MGKKRLRKTQTSKGIHSTVNTSIRVMVTIANPNKNQTNKRFIRVPASTAWNASKLKMLA